MIILKDKEDFRFHKMGLNAERKMDLDHEGGEPESFPCVVKSFFIDENTGPYFYKHFFAYKKRLTCSECGHEQEEWDYSKKGVDFWED